MLAQAEKCRDNPEIDVGPVQLASDLLHENVALKKENAKTRAELNDLSFHLSIGDWATNIRNEVRAYEKKACKIQRKELEKELAVDHKPKDAKEKAKEQFSSNWAAMRGMKSEDIHTQLAAETARVKAWRAGGGVEADAPETPIMDRIYIMCQLSGVEYDMLAEAVKFSVIRNEKAHAGLVPLLEDYNKADNKVDWDSLKETCAARKKWAQESAGHQWTKEQVDMFVRMIDVSLALWANAGPPTTRKESTKESKDENQKVGKSKKDQPKKADPPPSAYKNGKWDHILE